LVLGETIDGQLFYDGFVQGIQAFLRNCLFSLISNRDSFARHARLFLREYLDILKVNLNQNAAQYEAHQAFGMVQYYDIFMPVTS